MASSSASGITSDPSSSSSKIVPQSIRADGSIRKERKVKPGFTPTEDIAKFRSRRLLQEDERRAQAAAASGSRVGGGEEDELISGLEKMGIRNHGNYSSSLATAQKRELRPPKSYETTKTGAGRVDGATTDSAEVGSRQNGSAAKDTGLASSSSSRIQKDDATSSRSIHAPSGPSNNNSAFAKALRDATSTRSQRPSPSSATSTSSTAQGPHQSTAHSKPIVSCEKPSGVKDGAASSSSTAVSTQDAWDDEDQDGALAKAASADGVKEMEDRSKPKTERATTEELKGKTDEAKPDQRPKGIDLQQLDKSNKE